MKLFYSLLIFSLFAIYSCDKKSCSSKDEFKNIPSDQTDAFKNEAITPNDTVSLSVEGMSCKVGCVGAIEKKLNSLNGISEAKVNFDDKSAIVHFDNNITSKEDIISAVNGMEGYSCSNKSSCCSTDKECAKKCDKEKNCDGDKKCDKSKCDKKKEAIS